MTIVRFASRTALVGAALAALAACSGSNSSSGAGGAVSTGEDMSMGQASAPVKVIEYASPTCPHCGHFNEVYFPAFKKKYIDTGQVQYTFREMPVHGALDSAAFLVARCAPKDKYFAVIDAFMRAQAEYEQPGMSEEQMIAAYRPVLYRIAQSVGLSQQATDNCISDPQAVQKFNDRVQAEAKQYDVSMTPTFIIDGVKLDPDKGATLDVLDAAIQPKLKKH